MGLKRKKEAMALSPITSTLIFQKNFFKRLEKQLDPRDLQKQYKVILDPTQPVRVDPLPFHGMLQYPYSAPQIYPTDAEHQNYLSSYNTRVLEP